MTAGLSSERFLLFALPASIAARQLSWGWLHRVAANELRISRLFVPLTIGRIVSERPSTSTAYVLDEVSPASPLWGTTP